MGISGSRGSGPTAAGDRGGAAAAANERGGGQAAAPERGRGPRGPYARGRERERDLLEAALRIIGREGLGALSHRNVASEAGIPAGSASYYFPSRAALVRAAFEHLVARQLERIDAAVSEAGDAALCPEAVARRAMRVIQGELGEGGRADALAEFELVLGIARDPGLAPAYRRFQQRLEAVQEGMAERLGSRDPARDGRIIQAFLRGVELEALSRPDRRRDPALLEADLAHLLAALQQCS